MRIISLLAALLVTSFLQAQNLQKGSLSMLNGQDVANLAIF